jgi:hypothetical protein
MFEEEDLRNIFVPKWDEIIVEWRKLHNEELHGLCLSLNITVMTKSRSMIWAGHVARYGEKRNCYRSLNRIHLAQDREVLCSC